MVILRKNFLRRGLVALAVFTILCGGGGAYVWYWEKSPKKAHIGIFLSGNVPITFVRTAHGRLIVIDGGNDTRILREITDSAPIYRKSIDLMTITNSSEKNTVGRMSIIERYTVKNFIYPDTASIQKYTIDGVDIVSWPTSHGLVVKISIGDVSFGILGEATSKDITPDILSDFGTTTILILSHADEAHISRELFQHLNPQSIIIKKLATKKASPKVVILPKKSTKKKPVQKPFSIHTQKTAEIIQLSTVSSILFSTDGALLGRIK